MAAGERHLSADGHGPRVALVLPGGGARGAYEVGAMPELLPALEARGETVSICCGTSVGAINVAMLASQAGRHAAEQAETALTHWREMRKSDVIRPIVGPGLAVTAIRAVGDALDLPGFSLASVLDPAPLRRSLEHWVDWQALRANVRQGKVEAVCVLGRHWSAAARSGLSRRAGSCPLAGRATAYGSRGCRSRASTFARRPPFHALPTGGGHHPACCARPLHRRRHPPEHPDQAGHAGTAT